jgi:hypothetical protein
MRVGGQRQAPAALPTGKKPVPTVQEALWAPGRVWTSAGNLGPSGFDRRTVQPVGHRCADWAIVAHTLRSRHNDSPHLRIDVQK